MTPFFFVRYIHFIEWNHANPKEGDKDKNLYYMCVDNGWEQA